ncbi:MAG TPA: trypsin-like peptidase domain-containing protein [Armatimonadota bacterium]|nr:trypsin-like peptidase domain-containing protein [Armatimonadota bacterium]
MHAREDNFAPSTHRSPSLGAILVLAIIFGAIAGFGGAVFALWANQHGRLNLGSSEIAASVPMGSTSSSGSSPSAFTTVADQLDESVVNINTLAHQNNPVAMFFGGGGGSQVVRGLGTGIIVDANGYILTNYHVVGDADNITVTVMHKGGKRQYKAKLIGGDKQEDLAVIKISARGLRPVRFGNSDNLKPGEWVMAIGNPYGFEHTVSVGVVSALNRSLPVDDSVTLRNMIQTDASINPGNSGGPLVNLRGEIVGINSAIYVGKGSGEPQANGIGFSIPSNHAKRIMELLKDKRSIPHPFIGISYSEITDDMRSNLHLPVKQGVIVSQVLPSGPAGKAGITRGDVIVSIDGNELSDQAVLSDNINKKNVGDTVNLELRRWNDASGVWEKKDVKVTIGDKPANAERQLSPQAEQGPDSEQQPQQEPNESVPFPWPF